MKKEADDNLNKQINRGKGNSRAKETAAQGNQQDQYTRKFISPKNGTHISSPTWCSPLYFLVLISFFIKTCFPEAKPGVSSSNYSRKHFKRHK